MARARAVTTLSITLALVMSAAPSPVVRHAAQENAELRQEFIAQARVWLPGDISSKDLLTGPAGPGSFAPREVVECEYVDKEMTGLSPKFACVRAGGDELKVKYGGANGEVYGEVVASRLLWALGFGADRMYSVRVICKGCPARIGGTVRLDGHRILDPAAVERKLGEELSDRWAWEELEDVEPEEGGASRAERDALRLVAVLLQHSDSKPINQRLVCLQGYDRPARTCDVPLMMIGDLGITFGQANLFNVQPSGSVHLARWSALPVWKGTVGCVGNLSGSLTGTLKDPVISEEGRRFLADLLVQLTDAQIVDMFEAGRVELRPRAPESGRSGFPSVEEWAAAFKKKRAEIVDHRCAA